MSTVFKKFSKSDVSITPFTAHKQSTFTSASLVAAGGSFYSASFPTVAYKSGTGFEWAGSGSSDDPNNHKKYFQLDHLFYKNSKLDYSNKFSKIKYSTDHRVLYDKVNILSLPYKTIGYKIKPGSFSLTQGGITIIDDSKGNLIKTSNPFDGTLGSITDPDNSFRIFYLGPEKGYKYYNLSIEDGKEVVNVPSSYSKKGLLDDSYLFNEIEYKNVNFSTSSQGDLHENIISSFSQIDFNGEDSTVISPHNSRLNFNNDDDFSITFRIEPSFDINSGINDNEKRYIISKSTTKTVIQSPNLSNNTQITGSSQGIDVDAEPQFPFEIYWQSQSLHFKRFDGNITSEISASFPSMGDYGNVTCVKTGSTLQIFYFDVKKAEGIDNTIQCQNQANLYIGSKGGTSNFWTGSIEQVMIYNKALKESDVRSITHSPDGSHNKMGNIFYNNGLVTITNLEQNRILNPDNSYDFNLTYQGTHLIYENEYQCMAEQHEFDVTLNPSARKVKSKDSEDLANFATGSNFKPYVTTVGLYNDEGELLVVGKLGQAIRMTDEADTTYVVRFDT